MLLWARLHRICSDINLMSLSEKKNNLHLLKLFQNAVPSFFVLTRLALKHWPGRTANLFLLQLYPLTSGLSGGSCVATTPRLLASFEFWLRYLEERRRLVMKRKQHSMRS